MAGTIHLRAPFRIRLLYAFLQSIGIVTIGLCLLYVAYSFAPMLFYEALYDVKGLLKPASHTITVSVVLPPVVNTSEMEEAERIHQVQAQAKASGVDSHFSIVVPKISAASNVIANVDAGNEDEYLTALQKGVAHAKGTDFPGQGKLVYLFSHSTNSPLYAARFGAVFYLLRKVEKGDVVIVYFSDKKYEYRVSEKKIVTPSDTSWLKDKGLGEELILQTCTPPGTNWQRLLVIAKPI